MGNLTEINNMIRNIEKEAEEVKVKAKPIKFDNIRIILQKFCYYETKAKNPEFKIDKNFPELIRISKKYPFTVCADFMP